MASTKKTIVKKPVKKTIKRTITTLTTRRIPISSLTTSPSSFVSQTSSPIQQQSKRGIKCNADELRMGSLIRWGPENKLFAIKSVEKRMMGRRPTSLAVDLKCLTTNKVFPTRMMPNDVVDRVELDMKWLGFLYVEGDIGHLMNNDTFEQLEFPSEMIGKFGNWIPTDEKLMCQFYEGALFSIQPPDSVVWEVERDDTDLNSRVSIANYKNIFLANGEKLAVPDFIKPGDKVKIKLEDFAFMARANEQ